MANQTRIIPFTLATRAGNTLNGNYLAVNADGFTDPVSILRINNNTDRDILISYDGSTDHDYVQAGGELTLQFAANSYPPSNKAVLRAGTIVYVNGAAGGAGDLYVGGYYQVNT